MLLAQCTAEVAHFSLQWWTELSNLKHQINVEGKSAGLTNSKGQVGQTVREKCS